MIDGVQGTTEVLLDPSSQTSEASDVGEYEGRDKVSMSCSTDPIVAL